MVGTIPNITSTSVYCFISYFSKYHFFRNNKSLLLKMNNENAIAHTRIQIIIENNYNNVIKIKNFFPLYNE